MQAALYPPEQMRVAVDGVAAQDSAASQLCLRYDVGRGPSVPQAGASSASYDSYLPGPIGTKNPVAVQ
eukprot:5636317-Prymnesium_polylepis.2